LSAAVVSVFLTISAMFSLSFFLFFLFCDQTAAQRSSITTPASLETIRSFLHYHLYHETFYQLLRQQETCRIDDDKNETLKYLNNKVNSCSNPDFFPRILNAPQVTFKKVDSETKSQKSDNGESSSSSSSKKPTKKFRKGALLNHSQQSNHSFSSLNLSKTPDTSEPDDNDDKTIHKYLLFALVLPKHPFSRELVQALQIISPMFPSVTFYFGLGYEFDELCAQYEVKSFPKLLFVRNGILVKRYSDSRDPVALAIQIAKWVGKFPETIPVPVSAITSKSARLSTFYNYKSTWFTVPTGDSIWAKFLQALDSFFVTLSAGRSVEPLIAFSPQVTQWDFEIFLLTLLYTLIRTGSWVYPLISVRKNVRNQQTAEGVTAGVRPPAVPVVVQQQPVIMMPLTPTGLETRSLIEPETQSQTESATGEPEIEIEPVVVSEELAETQTELELEEETPSGETETESELVVRVGVVRDSRDVTDGVRDSVEGEQSDE
jgi:hypothetical protein